MINGFDYYQPCKQCGGYTKHTYIGKTKDKVYIFSCDDCGCVLEIKVGGGK